MPKVSRFIYIGKNPKTIKGLIDALDCSKYRTTGFIKKISTKEELDELLVILFGYNTLEEMSLNIKDGQRELAKTLLAHLEERRLYSFSIDERDEKLQDLVQELQQKGEIAYLMK